MRLNNKWAVLLALVFGLALIYSYASIGAGLNCTISTAGTCSDSSYLFFRNDSAGYYNAHAELPSVASYPFALCCDASMSNNTVNTSCFGTKFLNLNKTTDSHAQISTFSSYNNSACINSVYGNITCGHYNDTCPANYSCLTSIASSVATDNNDTNAHVGSCSEYNRKICCRLNNPPNSMNLTYPANNSIITNRTPNFQWNASDYDNDTLQFSLFITCQGGCAVDNRQYNLINYSNYTIPADLRYFGDDNYWYQWWVVVYDSFGNAKNSTVFNFTMNSLISLTLVDSTVDFGSMLIGQRDNTTDLSPPPFLLRNDGNSYVDVNLSAEDYLWDSEQSASAYFQYKVANHSNESGSFNWSASTTGWTNVPYTNETFLKLLNYSDANDTAVIDILVEVPLLEPVGSKSATITFTGKYVKRED